MTRRKKRLQKIRRNPRNVRYSDLVSVMEDYGFTFRDGKGSHRSATCELGERVWVETIVKPHGGKKHVNLTYVKRIILAIDEIITVQTELISNDEADENES